MKENTSLREEIEKADNISVEPKFIRITNKRFPVDDVISYELNSSANREDNDFYRIEINFKDRSFKHVHFKKDKKEYAVAAIKNMDMLFGITNLNHEDSTYF